MIKNLIINYFGQIYPSALSLLLMPIYILYMGAESVGLLGFSLLVMAWINLIDSSISPILIREFALFRTDNNNGINLLRTVEVISLLLSAIVIVTFFLCSDWLSKEWFNVQSLDIEVVSNSLKLIGVLICSRFFEGLYRNTLIGFEKFVLLNKIQIVFTTIRAGGAVLLITQFSTRIDVFFVWQLLISFLTVITFSGIIFQLSGGLKQSRKISLHSLKKNKDFSLGMFLHTLLVLILTQADKFLLSKLLSLSEFGYYSLAVSVSAVVFMFVAPVSQIYLPKFIFYAENEGLSSLKKLFHEGSQIVTIVSGSFSVVVAFFSGTILFLWLNDKEISNYISNVLTLMVLGNFINGLMWIPHTLQFSYKYTRLTIISNGIALIVYILSLLIIVPVYGILGASIIWFAINAFLLGVSIYIFMFSIFLQQERNLWLFKDVLAPIVILFIIGFLYYLIFPFNSGRIVQLLVLISLFVTSLCVTLYASKNTRELILNVIKSGKKGI